MHIRGSQFLFSATAYTSSNTWPTVVVALGGHIIVVRLFSWLDVMLEVATPTAVLIITLVTIEATATTSAHVLRAHRWQMLILQVVLGLGRERMVLLTGSILLSRL